MKVNFDAFHADGSIPAVQIGCRRGDESQRKRLLLFSFVKELKKSCLAKKLKTGPECIAMGFYHVPDIGRITSSHDHNQWDLIFMTKLKNEFISAETSLTTYGKSSKPIGF